MQFDTAFLCAVVSGEKGSISIIYKIPGAGETAAHLCSPLFGSHSIIIIVKTLSAGETSTRLYSFFLSSVLIHPLCLIMLTMSIMLEPLT
jgi:hypothetical protein